MQDAVAAKLVEVRDREGMSNAALARRLGVDPSLLSLVFQGQRRAGRKLLDAAFREFPEVRDAHLISLTPRHDNAHGEPLEPVEAAG